MICRKESWVLGFWDCDLWMLQKHCWATWGSVREAICAHKCALFLFKEYWVLEFWDCNLRNLEFWDFGIVISGCCKSTAEQPGALSERQSVLISVRYFCLRNIEFWNSGIVISGILSFGILGLWSLDAAKALVSNMGLCQRGNPCSSLILPQRAVPGKVFSSSLSLSLPIPCINQFWNTIALFTK